MKEIIIERLKKFERDVGVKVILAVESGSRGWGFGSEDSDYDVRFVYVYPMTRYLHLEKPMECTAWTEKHDGIDLDFEGFDIYKFYDLLLKSNMNIIDWLFQTNIYIDNMSDKAKLQSVVSDGFNRRTYIEHNYGLCNKNFKAYFANNHENPDEPTAKRYIYCIRAILSADYCAKHNTTAPLDFNELIKATLSTDEQNEIQEMLNVKKKREKARYKNAKWFSFIEDMIKSQKPMMPNNEFQEYYSKLNLELLKELERD